MTCPNYQKVWCIWHCINILTLRPSATPGLYLTRRNSTVQPFIQVNNNENTKATHILPFVTGGFPSQRAINIENFLHHDVIMESNKITYQSRFPTMGNNRRCSAVDLNELRACSGDGGCWRFYSRHYSCKTTRVFRSPEQNSLPIYLEFMVQGVVLLSPS